MLFGSLVLGSPEWIWPAVAIVAAIVLLLLWSYVRASADRWLRVTAMLLKLTGVLALAAILVEPLWSGTKPRPGANLFVILADNSQSLQIHDRGQPKSRGDALRELLTNDKAPWQIRLNQDFEVRRYFFDSRLQSTQGFGEMLFDGRASGLRSALATLAERYRGRPLAGVLLFTDGNATDISELELAAMENLPSVYPVAVGGDETAPDIAIGNLAVTQTSFEDAPVSLLAEVVSSGYSGKVLKAQLLDETGKTIEEQTQSVRDDRPLAFRFQWRPESSGVSFYRLQVAADDELVLLDQPEKLAEATAINNRRRFVVDRGEGPYRILYLAGRPNWEYKFLRRAIDEDEQVQLVGQIRIARREAKFDYRGRAGEGTNQLFRGFDKVDDETERYDQPVLVRLNTRDEAELRDGFPKTEEELFAYHALIFDDIEADFFTHEQMALVNRFVAERGGGFLMLGGAESFDKGKFHRTPIGDLLPVYLDRTVESQATPPFRMALTREGWLQPWVRLRSNEADETRRLTEMPVFQTLNRTQAIKPGASVLASVTDASGKEFPALIAQRFGQGRAAALTVGDAWRWALAQDEPDQDLQKAWRQSVRWLVADVPQRVEIDSAQEHSTAQQPVRLDVRVRDEKFKPLDDASVEVTVTLPDGDQVMLTTEPASEQAGVFQTTFIPREEGAYRARTTVRDSLGAEIGSAETGWTSDPAAEEFQALAPNRQLLQAIAEQSGGEVVELDRLESFVGSLPSRKLPITEPSIFPLWHQPLVFLFALACLIGEWGLRRWKGLA